MSLVTVLCLPLSSFFFFNDTATTEIYTLSLHDALPIYPHPLAVRLVAQVRDSLEFLGVDQLGDLRDQVALVDLIRDLGDDDLMLPGRFLLLDHRAGADRDPAAALLVALLDPLAAVDDRPGGEVGPLDELPQILHPGVGMVHQVANCLHRLGVKEDRKSTRLNSSH